jgi:RimJ/RimL family protein N-acetyltransferase
LAKRSIAPIEGRRIWLRLLEEADLPLTLAWRNQDRIRRWFLQPDVIMWEQHRAWFEQYRKRDDDFVFIIEEIESLRRPVGQVALYHIDWTARRAEFGRLLIGEDGVRGKGLAKEATALILDYGQKHLGLDKFTLEVFKDNAPAAAIYRSAGFVTVSEQDNVITMQLAGQSKL